MLPGQEGGVWMLLARTITSEIVSTSFKLALLSCTRLFSILYCANLSNRRGHNRTIRLLSRPTKYVRCTYVAILGLESRADTSCMEQLDIQGQRNFGANMLDECTATRHCRFMIMICAVTNHVYI